MTTSGAPRLYNDVSLDSVATTDLPPPYCRDNSPLDGLPEYTCSVARSGRLLLKRELDAPKHRAPKRRWCSIEVNLHGTSVRLCKSGVNITLSMQGGEVGLAPDYFRRSWVIRVRAEGHQFLLACQTQASMLRWYAAMREAIAISLPLDSRKEPRPEKKPINRPVPGVMSMYTWDSLCCDWREKWNRISAHRVWLQDTDIGTTNEACCGPETSVAMACIEDKRVPFEPGESVDEIEQVAIAPPTAKQRDVGPAKMQLRQHEQIDYACRCAHKISYASPWEMAWYLRDGLVLPTNAFVEVKDTRHSIQKEHIRHSSMTYF